MIFTSTIYNFLKAGKKYVVPKESRDKVFFYGEVLLKRCLMAAYLVYLLPFYTTGVYRKATIFNGHLWLKCMEKISDMKMSAYDTIIL